LEAYSNAWVIISTSPWAWTRWSTCCGHTLLAF